MRCLIQACRLPALTRSILLRTRTRRLACVWSLWRDETMARSMAGLRQPRGSRASSTSNRMSDSAMTACSSFRYHRR